MPGENGSPRQDTRSGGLDDFLASAEIGHDALVDLASEETFQAPDDLSLGSAVRRAACDVINGRLMVPHADDDGSIEGGVGVSVAASIEAVPAGGPPGRGRDRTRAARRFIADCWRMFCSAIFESDRLRTSAIAARCSSVIGRVETPASASFLRSRSMASSTADFGAESWDTSFGHRLRARRLARTSAGALLTRRRR